MKYREIMMRLTALGISAVMLCSTPTSALAVEHAVEQQTQNQKSTSAVADENGFIIQYGELISYPYNQQIQEYP